MQRFVLEINPHWCNKRFTLSSDYDVRGGVVGKWLGLDKSIMVESPGLNTGCHIRREKDQKEITGDAFLFLWDILYHLRTETATIQ